MRAGIWFGRQSKVDSPVWMVSLALALLLVGGCGASDRTDGVTPAGAGPSTAAVNEADVLFAQMMIPHHQQAVEMSTLAETRAAAPELRVLAADLKSAQQREIDTMTGWLSAWRRPTAAPTGASTAVTGAGHGHGGVPGMMTDEDMAELAGLRGADFDRKFCRMMIEHHNGAIEMARVETANGSDRGAIDLARKIVKTQLAEVVLLQAIRDRY